MNKTIEIDEATPDASSVEDYQNFNNYDFLTARSSKNILSKQEIDRYKQASNKFKKKVSVSKSMRKKKSSTQKNQKLLSDNSVAYLMSQNNIIDSGRNQYDE